MLGMHRAVIETQDKTDTGRAVGGSESPTGRKRALFVNHYGLLWPTGMVRAMQYRSLFEQSSSWQAEYTSRHSESFARLFRDGRLRSRLLVRLVGGPLRTYENWREEKREDEIVERAADFNLVSVVKSPGDRLYERLGQLRRTRVVMDLNDAVWLPYHDWRDLLASLARVDGVICENEYIASYVSQYNRRVFVVPDSPQVEVFDGVRSQVERDPSRVTIGWIGSAENVGSLYRILEPLEALFSRYPQLHLRIVGADWSQIPRFESVRCSCRASFNQQEMAREVLAFDIGLFPLFHNEDARARGTLKAMVYMSGEAVAVCEDYGENPKLIQDGVNGMLASSPEQWYEKLEYLIKHPIERAVIAKRGLEMIRDQFTAERVFARLVTAFEQVLA